jgi:hypothetical protein
MKSMKYMLPLLLALAVSGCATAPIIGPFSWMTSQHNKKARIRRSALISSQLTGEQKAKVIEATSWTTQPNEIAVGVQVDLLELIRSDYTWGETLKQLGGVTGDVVLYGLIGYAIQEADLGDDDDNEDGQGGVRIEVNGTDNDVNVVNGDSNVSNNDREAGGDDGSSNDID